MSSVIKKKERQIAPGIDQQKEMQSSRITEFYIQGSSSAVQHDSQNPHSKQSAMHSVLSSLISRSTSKESDISVDRFILQFQGLEKEF